MVSYEWTMEGHFLESRYEATIEGQVMWRDRTMIGWDRGKRRLVGLTFGMDGSIGWGTYEDRPDADTWVIHGSVPGDEVYGTFRSILRRLGPDRLEVSVRIRKDAARVDSMKETLDREPSSDR